MTGKVPFAPSADTFGRILVGDRRIQDAEMRRTLIKNDRLLSIPVEGGASALRGGNPSISQHGRWQSVHLGAWNAAYGKTPYFPHLFPEMERIYREESFGELAVFNRALLDLALRWTEAAGLREELVGFSQTHPERYEALKKEIATKVNYNLSIFDALFRLGKDTVFAVI